MLFPSKWLAIVLGGSLALQMAPGFATAVIEGEETSSFSPPEGVLLIRGDEKLAPTARPSATPPLPKTTTAAESQTDTPNYAMLGYATEAWSVPHRTQSQFQDLGHLIATYNKALAPGQIEEYCQVIAEISNSYGLDARLMASLVAVESSFRWNAISRSGAIGLGQLKPDTARWLGVQDPFDPVQNLAGVGKYLRYLLDRYHGNTVMALAAYYQGQGTIDRRGVNGEAKAYVGRINKVFQRTF